MGIENGKRFANTFLSIDNLAYAIPDEVLINKTNGHLYYKNLDGDVLDIFANIVIDSSNISEELTSLNDAIADNLNIAKQYTDEQVQLSSGGTGFKTVYYRYYYETVVDGETEVKIPLSTHNTATDLLILTVNTTVPDEGDSESGYTVTNGKITFHEGLDKKTGVSMLILKNVPVGEDGAVDANMLMDGTIMESKLDPKLLEKINSASSRPMFIISEQEPTDQPDGSLWIEVY